jgi:ribosomal protein L7/L12
MELVKKKFMTEKKAEYFDKGNLWKVNEDELFDIEKEKTEAEEKTEFDVVLNSAGGSKLATVMLIKKLTGFSLTEAKELVENVPSNIKEAVSKNEAESLIESLEEVGAGVELK